MAQQRAEIDHAGCKAEDALTEVGCTPVRMLTAAAGEKITIIINNTCPDLFEYSVVPVPASDRSFAPGGSRTPCRGNKAIDIVHDERYAGYIVHVVRSTGTPAAGDMRITIAVRTAEFEVGFSGGFALSGLTAPLYELRPAAAGDGEEVAYIISERSIRDDVAQSVVSFVHVHHTALSFKSIRPAFSFGLGIEPDRLSDYYLGASLQLGDRAAVTGGYVVGVVATLPAGRSPGDRITDANALATLGTRRAGSWFFGISYRFLGNGAADLNKPFQGEEVPGQRSAAATQNRTP